ncbi:protein of unknown function [Hyphomicrobium sp. MC1]|nr:protein of unknown function [Hyphomicrobium sp. MC1]
MQSVAPSVNDFFNQFTSYRCAYAAPLSLYVEIAFGEHCYPTAFTKSMHRASQNKYMQYILSVYVFLFPCSAPRDLSLVWGLKKYPTKD